MGLWNARGGPEHVFFTATMGRTGTTTLVEAFQLNVPDCVAEHEPAYRPSGWYEKAYRALHLRRMGRLERHGFGAALAWHDGDDPVLRRMIRMRARRIRRLGCRVYLESSHAFLSSLERGMVEEFPHLNVIHLIRDPLAVAVSFCNRNRHPADSPAFLAALGDWHPHPRLAKNCLPPPGGPLTRLQYYLWVWLEAELRFVRFRERHPDIRWFDLETGELADPLRLAALFQHFGIETRSGRITVPAVRNRNPSQTLITDEHRAEARSLFRRLRPELLAQLPFREEVAALAAG